MRIGVVSDTHGDEAALSACIRAAGQVDAWLHLGDHYADAKALAQTRAPIYAVRGNCDGLLRGGEHERVVELGGKRLFLCHGHTYGVKYSLRSLLFKARQLRCAAAFFGHTHVPCLDEGGDVLILNPGSASLPRGGSKRCMGIVLIQGERIDAHLLQLP